MTSPNAWSYRQKLRRAGLPIPPELDAAALEVARRWRLSRRPPPADGKDPVRVRCGRMGGRPRKYSETPAQERRRQQQRDYLARRKLLPQTQRK